MLILIRSIKGILSETEIADNYNIIVIEVGGIGFELKTSMTAAAELPVVGETVKLYSYLHVREDILELYGFIEKDEMDIFIRLISVSGVGPKKALPILSALTPAQLTAAVNKEEPALITRAKGVGLQLAKKIVLELKGKLSAYTGSTTAPTQQSVGAIEALTALGYSQNEASAAINSIDNSLSVEEQVKAALQVLFKTK